MVGHFEPFPEGGASPGSISDAVGVETPERVNLEETPSGTLIEFHGLHPASNYISKVVEEADAGKRIILWRIGMHHAAIAPINELVSMPGRKPLDDSFDTAEAVMALGCTYFLPNFYPPGDHLFNPDPNAPLRLVGGQNGRVETYTSIFLLKPELAPAESPNITQ